MIVCMTHVITTHESGMKWPPWTDVKTTISWNQLYKETNLQQCLVVLRRR